MVDDFTCYMLGTQVATLYSGLQFKVQLCSRLNNKQLTENYEF